jgi:iron(III) transport system substrate-binding protein
LRTSLAVALCVLFVACGPPTAVTPSATPTTSGPPPTAGGSLPIGSPPGNDALEAVYAAVEGLTGDERRAKLVELADAEGSEVTVYTSTNLDESEPLVSAFEEATGVEVNLYRASASTVIQRVTQEASAGFEGGADIIAINGPEMTILDADRLLAPLDTPATANVLPQGIFPTWSAMYLNVFIAAWNTDNITPDEAPATYQELFTDYQGRLGMELGDWDWFATLVKYFVAEEGMTEDAAVQMFKDAAAGARVVDGHTLMTELLAAGEFDITASNYQHRVFQLVGEGAPIAWEPAVQPIVVRPNGIGIRSGAEHPAGALLYLEYVLGEGQDLFLELERTPASTDALGGLQGDFDILFADVQALLDESDRWEGLYEEVVAESGQVIEEE